MAILTFAILSLLVCPVPELAADSSGQWQHWRGPQQNYSPGDTGLIESEDPKESANGSPLWQNESLGDRSTPIVFDGRLYTIVRDRAD